MLTETGRAPTPEELAEKLAIPAEKVRRLLEIASANLDRVQGQLGLTGND
jgi:DNA-directed RNA polymerase sigma subunit (sigma70/sigma32)